LGLSRCFLETTELVPILPHLKVGKQQVLNIHAHVIVVGFLKDLAVT